MNPKSDYRKLALSLALTSAVSLPLAAQTAPAPSQPAAAATATPAKPVPVETAKPAAAEEDVVLLSPFEVTSEAEKGYSAADTLAGNRLNTEIRDLGNAVTVVTSQFLKDIGATSSETLLQYTTNTEVGNIHGNMAGVGDSPLLNESSKFTNPNQNTRVRGLTSADYTREFFKSDTPWDGYNVDRVDFQRGPNSILFGQGSPGGIINTSTKQARYKDAGELEFRLGSHDTYRTTLDVNRVLIDQQLAIRIAALNETEHFKQKPAYEQDRRIYAATRWDPAFLAKGSARTIVKGTFEAGNVRSNRPRSLPPIDLITPWFATGTYNGTFTKGGLMRDLATNTVKSYNAGDVRVFNNLNKSTYNPFQLQDDNTGRANHGQQRTGVAGGVDANNLNPYFQPWIGNFAQSYGGPLAYYSTDTTAAPSYYLSEWRQGYSINTAGVIDNGGIVPFHRQGGIATMDAFARLAGLPYSVLYKNQNLTDSSVFDYYNNLLDGPNKREWQDFHSFNASIVQTFFHDHAGFELVYDKQFYKNGQTSLLSDSRQAIYIDFMSVYSDGTPTGKGGEPYQDGTPNPNVGRAFVSDSGQYGNNSNKSDRDSVRATAFLDYDFAANNKTVLTKILGHHKLTGLLERDEQETDGRSWQRYAILDPNYISLIKADPTIKFTDNLLALNHVIYLGPSLINRPSASGAYLPNPSVEHIPTSGSIRMFDSHWNKPTDSAATGYVNPAAPWTNDYYPVGQAGNTSTQSENPANYVGWRNVPFTITDADASAADRDALTTNAQIRKVQVTSRGVVVQSHFWDKLVVLTGGIRRDTVRDKVLRMDYNSASPYTRNSLGQLNLGSDVYKLPDDWNPKTKTEATSKSYGAVIHLDQYTDKFLPFHVSAFYAHSTNFQPEASRVDVYGQPIALPGGTTIERGILLESKDGKYSLKVNKFKTEAKNANSSGLGGAWFIGSSQTWAGNWANRFEFNWTSDTSAGAVLTPDPNNSQYNYARDTGETLAQAQAREAAAIAAWRTWQNSVDPRFYTAWKINLADKTKSLTSTNPTGFALTEDSTSKGLEFEFNAQPLKNWRLTFNASKADASRRNIGGAALADFIAKYEKALTTTAAGDMRIWWGNPTSETSLFQWKSNIGAEWALRSLQEGTSAPELRKWRWNAISNYDFQEGFLKGVNVGVGVRWQDAVIIGYRPVPLNAAKTEFTYDLANPYRGPKETNFDFWIGYGRRLSDGIDWRVQLNVTNAFEGNGLIPITTQPDGTPAGYRIKPSQRINFSNTFKF